MMMLIHIMYNLKILFDLLKHKSVEVCNFQFIKYNVVIEKRKSKGETFVGNINFYCNILQENFIPLT